MAGKRWNGTTFIDLSTTRKRWNGSAWVDITIAKRWNGSAWIDLFPDGPPVDPNLPTGSWNDGSSSASSYYACEQTLDPLDPNCPISYTFNLTKAYTTSAGTTVTGKAVAGVSYTFFANSVTFSASVQRSLTGESVERTPTLLLTNSFGTTELPFSWELTYYYTVEGGEPV